MPPSRNPVPSPGRPGNPGPTVSTGTLRPPSSAATGTGAGYGPASTNIHSSTGVNTPGMAATTQPGTYGASSGVRPITPADPWANLSGQQVIDARGGMQGITLGAMQAQSQLDFDRGMAGLGVQQTRGNVLRSLGNQQADLRRNFSLSLEDLTRGVGRGQEDLNRNVDRSLENLQRNFDRSSRDLDTGFDRAAEDLGINRDIQMTSLIDSLGARGIRGSGLGNRFQGDAADSFDRQGTRLAEDRTLRTGDLADDLSFGQRRLEDDRSFGLGRLADDLSFGSNRLNSNLAYGLERAESNSSAQLSNLMESWAMQEARFDTVGTEIDVMEQAGLDQWELQVQTWSGDNAAATVQVGQGSGGSGQNGGSGLTPGQQRRIASIRANDNLTAAQRRERIEAVRNS